jgi:hypothetical protein
MAAVWSPLLAVLYVARPRRRGLIWNTFLVSMVLVGALSTSLHNVYKPILGPRSIWGSDRLQAMYLRLPDSPPIVRLVDRIHTPEWTLGLVPAHEDAVEYPFFGEFVHKRVVSIRVDRPELLQPENLPQVDLLYLEADTQRFFLTEATHLAIDASIGQIDLGPLIARLRSPDSGWESAVDLQGWGYIFAKRHVSGRLRQLSGLPEVVLPSRSWSDGWISKRFLFLIHRNDRWNFIEIEGDLPSPAARGVLSVICGVKALLAREVNGPCRIQLRVSRKDLPPAGALYLPLELRANWSYNPKLSGESSDDRDLSWRLHSIRLSPD